MTSVTNFNPKNNNKAIVKERVLDVLPGHFQTETNKKFFSAAFDHVFQPGSSERLSGFIGKKPLYYNNKHDFYINDQSSDRNFYQLEPTITTSDSNNIINNSIYYTDIVNHLRFQGGIVDNHNRLFEGEIYNWMPPIDPDKFINYNNYVWVADSKYILDENDYNNTWDYIENETFNNGYDITELDLQEYDAENVIEASGPGWDYSEWDNALSGNKVKLNNLPTWDLSRNIDVTHINGLENHKVFIKSYTGKYKWQWDNNSWDDLNNWDDDEKDFIEKEINLSSGMILKTLDDIIYFVEGVGRSIKLVNASLDTNYADLTINPSYMVIGRDTVVDNPWSFINRWVHRDTLPEPDGIFARNNLAKRPIIEFNSNLELYNYGSTRRDDVTYIIDTDLSIDKNIIGKSVDTIIVDSNQLNDNDTVLIIRCQDKKYEGYVYTITIDNNGLVHLLLKSENNTENGFPLIGNIIKVTNGSLNSNKEFVYNGVKWVEAQTLISENQAPLFQLYDVDGYKLNDIEKYPNSDFRGNKIWSYSIDNTSSRVDKYLNLKTKFKIDSITGKSQFIFENNLVTNRSFYKPELTELEIKGFYSYNILGINEYQNSWFSTNRKGRQFLVDQYICDGISSNFILSRIPDPSPDNEPELNQYVYVDQKRIDYNQYSIVGNILKLNTVYPENTDVKFYGYSNTHYIIDESESDEYIKNTFIYNGTNNTFFLTLEPEQVSNKPLIIVFIDGNILKDQWVLNNNNLTINANIKLNSKIDVLISISAIRNTFGAFYEIPINLSSNPENDEPTLSTKSQFFDHFIKIIEQQQLISGNPYGRNTYRDTKQDVSVLGTVIQHRNSLLRLGNICMLPTNSDYNLDTRSRSNPNTDFMMALRNGSREYIRYKNKFLLKAKQIINSGELTEANTTDEWVDYIINSLKIGKTSSFPYFASRMASTNNIIETYIPETPSFLGICPLTIPSIIIDDTKSKPIKMIVGHDSSKTLCYNDYRDNVLLRFEERIYESTNSKFKKPEILPDFDLLDYCPGKYRKSRYRIWKENEYYNIGDCIIKPTFPIMLYHCKQNHLSNDINDFPTEYSNDTWVHIPYRSDYDIDEINKIFQPLFYDWTVINRIDYKTNKTYNSNDPWTWNYSSSVDYDGELVPGHWQGIYEYYYDTYRPHSHPWEMLGFYNKPEWWDTVYGIAPYTSGNYPLWRDLRDGRIQQGPRKGVWSKYRRPNLLDIIPVDRAGNLLPPLETGIISNLPDTINASADWKFGDRGPAEQVFRDDPSYSFAKAGLGYLIKPARFIEQLWDSASSYPIMNTQYGAQWISGNNKNRRIRPIDNQVHGENINNKLIINTGVQVLISNYISSRGQSITSQFGDVLRRTKVSLGHKMRGFTTSNNLTISTDSGILAQPEDITVQFYRSNSTKETVYSGVIITKVENGYNINGYDQRNPWFNIKLGDQYGNKQLILANGQNIPNYPNWRGNTYYERGYIVQYRDTSYRNNFEHTSDVNFDSSRWSPIPGTNKQNAVSIYLDSIEDYDIIPYNTTFKTPSDVANFLINYERYLNEQGWVFETLNENINEINDFKLAVRQFLGFITNKQIKNGDFIAISPGGDFIKFKSIYGAVQYVEQIVNGVYSLSDQSGRPIDPKATSIIRYNDEITITPTNTKIFCARLNISELEHIILLNNTLHGGDIIFDPIFSQRQHRLRFIGLRTKDWTGRLDAPGFLVTDNIIIPNYDKISDDPRKWFDIEDTDIGDLQQKARSNIGYQSRPYIQDLILTETGQFEFYQGAIRNKGTTDSLKKLLRSSYIEQLSDVELLDEWAFRIGRYGAIETTPVMEFLLNQSDIKNAKQLVTFKTNQNVQIDNPYDDIVEIIDYTKDGVLIEKNNRWMRRPNDPNNIFKSRSTEPKINDLPNAGYVRLDEIEYTLFSINDLNDLYWTQKNNGNPLLNTNKIWIYDMGPLFKNGLFDNPWSVERISRLNGSPTYITKLEPDPFYNELTIIETNIITNVKPGDRIMISGNTRSEPNKEGIYEIVPIMGSEWDSDPWDEVWWEPYGDSDSNFAINETIRKKYDWNDANDNPKLEIGPEIFIFSSLRFDIFDGLAEWSPPDGWVNTDKAWVDVDKPNPSNISEFDVSGFDDIAWDNSIDTPGRWAVYYAFDNPMDGWDLLEWDSQIDGYDGRFYRDVNEYLRSVGQYGWDRLDRFDENINAGFDVYIDTGDNIIDLVYNSPNESPHWSVKGWDIDPWDDDLSIILLPKRHEIDWIDNNLIKNSIIYDKRKYVTLETLMVYDPIQGIIPGVADKEIWYKLPYDPAKYTNGDELLHNINPYYSWGKEEIGRLWWDINKVRYIQPDLEDLYYTSKFWGEILPKSEICIYEWTRSIYPPSQYKGSGSVNIDQAWVQINEYDNKLDKTIIAYYYWVKSPNIIPANTDFRKISAQTVTQYLTNPSSEDISWIAPINKNSIILSGAFKSLRDNDSVVQINWTLDNDDRNIHNQYLLLREKDIRIGPDPLLWMKMSNSLVGFDNYTYTDVNNNQIYAPKIVPDNMLSPIEKLGTLFRPRQTWFIPEDDNSPSIKAKHNLVDIVNIVLGKYDISLTNPRWDNILFKKDPEPTQDQYNISVNTINDMFNSNEILSSIWDAGYWDTSNWDLNNPRILVKGEPSTGNFWTLWEYTNNISINENPFKLVKAQLYDCADIFDIQDWFDPSYFTNRSVRPTEPFRTTNSIPTNVNDLPVGTIVKINNFNNTNKWVWYAVIEYETSTDGIIETQKTWKIVAKQDASLKLNNWIYDNNRLNYCEVTNDGISLPIIDNIPYRKGMWELKTILETLPNVLPIIDLNEIFFSMVSYVHTEQGEVDWAFKTSFMVMTGMSEQLTQEPIITKDKTESYVSYIKEYKPYHVKIRDLVRRLNAGIENICLCVTDFDKFPIYDLLENKNYILNPLNSNDYNYIKNDNQLKRWAETLYDQYTFKPKQQISINGNSYTTDFELNDEISNNSFLTVYINGKILKHERDFIILKDNKTIRINYSIVPSSNDLVTIIEKQIESNTFRTMKISMIYDRVNCSNNQSWDFNTNNDKNGWNSTIFDPDGSRISRFYKPTNNQPRAIERELLDGCDFKGIIYDGSYDDLTNKCLNYWDNSWDVCEYDNIEISYSNEWDVLEYDTDSWDYILPEMNPINTTNLPDYLDRIDTILDGSYEQYGTPPNQIFEEVKTSYDQWDTNYELKSWDDKNAQSLGEIDIIVDGGYFIQPRWDACHPEELTPTKVTESFKISVYDTFGPNISNYKTQEEIIFEEWDLDNWDIYTWDSYTSNVIDIGQYGVAQPEIKSYRYYINDLNINIYNIPIRPVSTEGLIIFLNNILLENNIDYYINNLNNNIELLCDRNIGDCLKITSINIGNNPVFSKIFKGIINTLEFNIELDNDSSKTVIIKNGEFINPNQYTINNKKILLNFTTTETDIILVNHYYSNTWTLPYRDTFFYVGGIPKFKLSNTPATIIPGALTVWRNNTRLQGPQTQIWYADGVNTEYDLILSPTNINDTIVLIDFKQTTYNIISGKLQLPFVPPKGAEISLHSNINSEWVLINDELTIIGPLSTGDKVTIFYSVNNAPQKPIVTNYIGTIDGRYPISQYVKPDYLDVSKNGVKQIYGKDYLLAKYPFIEPATIIDNSGYDVLQYDVELWDDFNNQEIIDDNDSPYCGWDYIISNDITDYEGWEYPKWDICGNNDNNLLLGEWFIVFRQKHINTDIVNITLYGEIISENPKAWMMFRDGINPEISIFNEDNYKHWEYNRISDHHTMILKNEILSGSTSIELIPNPEIIYNDRQKYIMAYPDKNNNNPGVVWIGSERIEYWTINEIRDNNNVINSIVISDIKRGTRATPHGIPLIKRQVYISGNADELSYTYDTNYKELRIYKSVFDKYTDKFGWDLNLYDYQGYDNLESDNNQIDLGLDYNEYDTNGWDNDIDQIVNNQVVRTKEILLRENFDYILQNGNIIFRESPEREQIADETYYHGLNVKTLPTIRLEYTYSDYNDSIINYNKNKKVYSGSLRDRLPEIPIENNIKWKDYCMKSPGTYVNSNNLLI